MDEQGLLHRLEAIANVGQSPADVFWEYLQHVVRVCELLMIYQQHRWDAGELAEENVDASEGLIRTITIVIDAKGLNYSMLWKPALDLLKVIVTRMFQYYPNCLQRIIVVNCPKMVWFAYNIVKGFFDVEFRKKIHLHYPKDSLAALEKVIDRRYIPHFLGGDCHCEDNCIGNYDPNSQNFGSDIGENADETTITENITLRAGRIYEKSFFLKKGESVIWEFIMKEGKYILFSSYFIPSSVMESLDQIEQHSKKNEIFTHYGEKCLVNNLIKNDSPTEGVDSYEAVEDGMLLLVWDNKKSWFSSKKIQMKVFKHSQNENSVDALDLQCKLSSSQVNI
ncbi:unnamed protein product [Phytomonas sp. Hart1]|nr:unnamed protein product [Phytomonas sp. Hart1]|eukprot:CCW70618.1 unnamed protein product [Phytomonas sp. isolate Hart1]